MTQQIEIGQTVHVRDLNLRRPDSHATHPYMVVRIGRIWAYASRGHHEIRFNKDTLRVDGGGYAPNYAIYLTEDGYAQEVERQDTWRKIGSLTRAFQPPKHITTKELREILAKMENTNA